MRINVDGRKAKGHVPKIDFRLSRGKKSAANA